MSYLDDKNLSKSSVWKTLTGATKPIAETLFALAKVLGFEIGMYDKNEIDKFDQIKDYYVTGQWKETVRIDSNELIPKSEATNNIEVKK